MVISDVESLGYLGKSRKSAPVVPVNTNFDFPFPLPGGPIVGPAGGGPFMAPNSSMDPTMAPTFLGSNMPWIIGASVLVVGVAAVVTLWKMGKI